jgi:hypothetical protein
MFCFWPIGSMSHLPLESWLAIVDNEAAFFLEKIENSTRQEAKRWPGTVDQKNTAADKQSVS